MIAAIVTAPENIARLEEIRDEQPATRRLPPLGERRGPRPRRPPAGDRRHRRSIHATEIGATQTVNELLYELATTDDPDWLAILRQTVDRAHPVAQSRRAPPGDGLVRAARGARAFDGAPMPWLYHKYAGHDINRDAFMLNLAENRRLAHFFYREWHPQVFLTMHQMGTARAALLRAAQLRSDRPELTTRSCGGRPACSGSAMASRSSATARRGVVSNALYDYYWPGYEDSAPLGHNTVCLLTEVASARLAAPIDIPPGELVGSQRGLPEYRAAGQLPEPVARRPLAPARHRRLRADRRARPARRASRATAARSSRTSSRWAGARSTKGVAGDPFAFVIAAGAARSARGGEARVAADRRRRRGAPRHRAVPDRRDATTRRGTDVVLMAQPFRAYAKTLLERQQLPGRAGSRPTGPPNGRTTSPGGRCRCRWASPSTRSTSRSSSR